MLFHLFFVFGFLFPCRAHAFLHSENTFQTATDSTYADSLARAAEAKFSTSPRTHENVKAAFDLMTQAFASSEDQNRRYHYLSRTAWFAIWQSYHGRDKREITDFASRGIALAKKAIKLNSERVEGYYYRAIATGLFAEQHQVQSKDAMKHIRSDAVKAIKIDPTLDHGGPHRLLGALYLRAPGPPAGIGSRRRALTHLNKAVALSPDYPENMLFLAEAYQRIGQHSQARDLLERVLASEKPGGDLMDRKRFRRRAEEMREKLK
ncbi:MAG: tetratricopeptide repeat protein [bacterium]